MHMMLKYIDQTFDKLVKYASASGLIWSLLFLGTVLVFVVPLKYLLDFSFFSNTMHTPSMATPHNWINNLLLYSHIAFSFPAIMLGIWMFNTSFRENNLTLHRKLGQIYVIGCLMGGITVIPLALNNDSILAPKIGFTMMGSIWICLTYFGYTSAIHKNYAAHRRWMMRSYAVTYAFVHVNFTYPLILPYEALGPEGVKVFMSMISWMTNLFLVEIYLAATNHQGKFWGFKRWFKTLSSRYNKLDRFYWNWRPAKRLTPA